LLLFVAMLSIASLGLFQQVEFQIKRDREEELIHRGVQYSRAIRKYVKQFGRYPGSIEDLESTNNIRFLRKRYKDPITGEDFRLLHMENLRVLGAQPGGTPSSTAVIQKMQPGAKGVASPAPASPQQPAEATSSPTDDANAVTNAEDDVDPSATPEERKAYLEQKKAEEAEQKAADAQLEDLPGSGGPPIVGVASVSKLRTIREFNKQNHYNQWLFIYSPGIDSPGLLNTPYQPPPREVGSPVDAAGLAPSTENSQ
jgi:type II secretory pathway pseudopilin PulG